MLSKWVVAEYQLYYVLVFLEVVNKVRVLCKITSFSCLHKVNFQKNAIHYMLSTLSIYNYFFSDVYKFDKH